MGGVGKALVWSAVSSERQAAEDKISLQDQELRCKEWAERQGYFVTDVLTVPGESRWEADIVQILEDYEQQGIYAYHNLRTAWRQQAFDVLVCYHTSRLGRSMTLQSWVIENVVRSGAKIYRIIGGWIGPEDYNIQIAMGGFSATTEVDRLVASRKAAMRKRAQQGHKTGPHVLFGYLEERDERGKLLRQVPDPALAPLWEKVASLLLEGIPWMKLEEELYRRWGITDPRTGRPFARTALRSIMMSTTFWGNTGQNYRNGRSNAGQASGPWLFDRDYPVPTVATIYYDTHIPIYHDEHGALSTLGAQVRDEVRRRMEVIQGKARPDTTSRFSGVAICDTCKYNMVLNSDSRLHYKALRCDSRIKRPELGCPQTKQLNYTKLQAFFTDLIGELLNSIDPGALFSGTQADTEGDLRRISSQISALNLSMDRLLSSIESMDRDNPVYPRAMQRLVNTGEQIKALEAQQRAVLQKAQAAANPKRTHTLDEIKAMSLAVFWAQPDRAINQQLHAILSPYRLRVDQGEIVGFTDQRRPRKGRV